MSTTNDGGPAFPQHGWTTNPEVLERMKNQVGMTLRDWFAGQALNGYISAGYDCGNPESVAKDCFDFADAMLKARSK